MPWLGGRAWDGMRLWTLVGGRGGLEELAGVAVVAQGAEGTLAASLCEGQNRLVTLYCARRGEHSGVHRSVASIDGAGWLRAS